MLKEYLAILPTLVMVAAMASGGIALNEKPAQNTPAGSVNQQAAKVTLPAAVTQEPFPG